MHRFFSSEESEEESDEAEESPSESADSSSDSSASSEVPTEPEAEKLTQADSNHSTEDHMADVDNAELTYREYGTPDTRGTILRVMQYLANRPFLHATACALLYNSARIGDEVEVRCDIDGFIVWCKGYLDGKGNNAYGWVVNFLTRRQMRMKHQFFCRLRRQRRYGYSTMAGSTCASS